jgi:hypothetical protein
MNLRRNFYDTAIPYLYDNENLSFAISDRSSRSVLSTSPSLT